MSTDYCVWLGPYARCRVERVPGEKPCCVNPVCPKLGYVFSGKHCYECGKKIGAFMVPLVHERVNHWTISEVIHDRLATHLFKDPDGVETRVYFPNVEKIDGRQSRFYATADVWEEVLWRQDSIVNPAFEVDWFRRDYVEALGALHEAYGEGNVELVWGSFSFTV